MATAKKVRNAPDYEDAFTAALDVAAQYGLLLRYELQLGSARTRLICRSYRSGAVRRADVVHQAFTEWGSSVRKDLGTVAYGLALDISQQAFMANLGASEGAYFKLETPPVLDRQE